MTLASEQPTPSSVLSTTTPMLLTPTTTTTTSNTFLPHISQTNNLNLSRNYVILRNHLRKTVQELSEKDQ